MMTRAALPVELVFDILSLAILAHPRPSSILLVSSQFYDLSIRLLYRHLYFKSCGQIEKFLQAFSSEPTRVPCSPCAIELDLNNDGGRSIFLQLQNIFLICVLTRGTELDQRGRPVLDLLKLRLHTLTQDPNPGIIYDALCSVNPKRFIWTGRDPPHHFSIAIVPQVLPHLFRALATYTHLTYVQLTHLSFDSLEDIIGFPLIPSLQQIYIGQATFLTPSKVATFVLSPGAESLQQFRLVDTYIESIWGLRLRRSDVEKAAMIRAIEKIPVNDGVPIFHTQQITAEAIELVRRVVVCEGKTERIIGGDRAVLECLQLVV